MIVVRICTENEVDGSTLGKLTEAMVARLLPRMKLQVQFLDLQKSLLAGQQPDSEQQSPAPAAASVPATDAEESSLQHLVTTASEQNG